MHIVYLLTFQDRKDSGIKPYYYIGSKSNCTVSENKIYDSRGNPYYGSSSWDEYHQIVQSSIVKVTVLKEFVSYTDALNYEMTVQKSLDVVADPRYFNKSIATMNVFTNPDYATYKHAETGKAVRLEKRHPMVLSGEYHGVTKGNVLTEEQKKSKGRAGEQNPFYGRRHNQKTKDAISKANTGNRRNEEDIAWFVEHVAKAPRTEEWKRKIGRPGLVTLKNIDTGECVRIPKEDRKSYDSTIWKPPTSLKQRRDTCIHCGKESVAGNIKRWHNDNCKHKPH